MFSNKQYIDFIKESKTKGLDIVVVSVIKTQGSTYAKAGNMMLINNKGESIGVLGSALLHNRFLEVSKEAFKNKKTIYHKNTPIDKNSGHGVSEYIIQAFFYEEEYGALGKALNSYGKTWLRSIDSEKFSFIDKKENKFENGIFYQYIQMPYSILIFGSGRHVSSFISMCNLLGWKTTVIDMKIDNENVKDADNLIELKNLNEIFSLDLSIYNASVILSHSPKKDDVYLEALLKSSVEYIGIMGNKTSMKNKIEKFSLEKDKRFFAPIGFDIGGNTPETIALSICSQIEARKNGKI
ncbi:MAG: XdhC family protein [Campylobacteraceae bacterium]|nr:XdhC family protein [Campylobacteraceae bacterium]